MNMTDTPFKVSLPWHNCVPVIDLFTGYSLQASFNRAIEEGAKPRIMLINSPSNPTGQTFSHSTLHEITNFCRDNSITLISDEIYADLTFDEKDRTTPCSKENFDAGRMIMTGGLSKV
jgi:aspartate aminotransferase